MDQHVEQVMVVTRVDLQPFIENREFDIIRDRTDEILDLIATKHMFVDRPVAEETPAFKQIIPYVAIRHDDSWYLLKRLPKQAEARLHDKLSLGVGGHVNPDTPTLLEGLHKELEEEVGVEDPFELRFIGILNDETTEVSRVHLGAVFVLDASSERVSVRETDKMTGEWVKTADLAPMRDRMETWSQIVYDQVVSG